MISEQDWMNLAIALAKKGKGQTWTNPLVGAVIVKNGAVLAQGYHHRFGQEHAEVDALEHLEHIQEAKGATMYVTLEPCSHFGKTPPCARRLVDVGLSKVVIGQLDPNPLVAGKGRAILEAAGIETKILRQIDLLNEHYNFFYRQNRPYLTLKYAMTLDGKINQTKGERSLLTGKEAYCDSQKLRTEYQAILIGENTLRIDNPQLTVRQAAMDFQPWRVILVRDVNQIDEQQRLFQNEGPIFLLSQTVSTKRWASNVEVVVRQQWNPQDVLQFLAEQGIQSILIEGGSHLQATFMASGLVDEIVVYVAPIIYGGGALPAIWGNEFFSKEDYQLIKTSQLGVDTKFKLRRI